MRKSSQGKYQHWATRAQCPWLLFFAPEMGFREGRIEEEKKGANDLDERMNGCDGKVRFRHGLAAMTTMISWVARESLDLYLFSIYPCRNCHFWHIGRYHSGAMDRGDTMENHGHSPHFLPDKSQIASLRPKSIKLSDSNDQMTIFWLSTSDKSWVYWNGDFDLR